ncbi:MAG: heavy-metal-associated domain-containing protein [Acidobacteria bacterium]|nr:heavy-metal-associated domain-containing protein [Acidobacteriota bacterium]
MSLEKLEGVRAAKVSLNQGRATIELQPGNKVSLADIRERVRRNGFTPQGATVTVRARVLVDGDRLRLEVPETKETFEVATTPHAEKLAQLKKHVGQVVTVKGLIAAPKDKAAAVIQITDVTAEGAKP